MSICLDISRFLSVLNSFFAYSMLFQSRLSKRTTAICIAMMAVIMSAVNVCGAWILGAERILQLLSFTFTIPCMCFFFAISRYRDIRFFFTFFATHLLSLWAMGITSLFHLVGGDSKYVLMLVSRIVVFACMDVCLYTRLRSDYHIAQQALKKGWVGITLICALFYLLILVSSAYPTPIWTRPQALSTYMLIMLILPIALYTMLYMITREMTLQHLEAQQMKLRVQIDAMNRQIVERVENDKRMRIFRHDIRHSIHQFTYLLKAGDKDAALDLIAQYSRHLSQLEPKRYCENMTVNAMLAYYLQQAEENGIRTETSLDIPANIKTNAIDLSILLANLLENADNACKALPESDRWIRIVCAAAGTQLTLEIANPYRGEVRFDGDGLPVNAQDDHGIGSHSVALFARNHKAQWDICADGHVFRVRLLIP